MTDSAQKDTSLTSPTKQELLEESEPSSPMKEGSSPEKEEISDQEEEKTGCVLGF
jgi:hypothetical protein